MRTLLLYILEHLGVYLVVHFFTPSYSHVDFTCRTVLHLVNASRLLWVDLASVCHQQVAIRTRSVQNLLITYTNIILIMKTSFNKKNKQWVCTYYIQGYLGVQK